MCVTGPWALLEFCCALSWASHRQPASHPWVLLLHASQGGPAFPLLFVLYPALILLSIKERKVSRSVPGLFVSTKIVHDTHTCPSFKWWSRGVLLPNLCLPVQPPEHSRPERRFWCHPSANSELSDSTGCGGLDKAADELSQKHGVTTRRWRPGQG